MLHGNYHSITVAFHPNESLRNQIKILSESGINPIVIFNSPYIGELDGIDNISLIQNDSNFGLAKAINDCVNFAARKSSLGFLLFDQDSIIDRLYVINIISSYRELVSNGANVSSVGAIILNQSDKSVWPFPVRQNGRLQFIRKANLRKSQVDFTITSGTFIPMASWRVIGGYNEAYFIDGLDIEWGYRALSLGFKNYIDSEIFLNHSLGIKSVQVFPFLKKRMIIHSAIRRYYIYRNFIWMTRLDYIPFDFKIHYARKLFKMILVIPFSPVQWSSMFQILRGLSDGIFRKPNTLIEAS